MSELPEFTIKVPITLVNKVTRIKKDLMMVADWVSMSKVD